MRKIQTGAALAALLLATAPALANDSSAELAAGGLVLTHDEDIEMRSEDLSISREAVKVHYVFRNTTDHDVTALVAFPMPGITGDIDFMEAVPTEDAENILGFSTIVDGRPVKARVEQRVFFKNQEYTTLLKRWGVPLAPHIEAMRTNIAEDLALPLSCVNVKAKTNEKLGYLGRGEGIEAQAVVLLSAA